MAVARSLFFSRRQRERVFFMAGWAPSFLPALCGAGDDGRRVHYGDRGVYASRNADRGTPQFGSMGYRPSATPSATPSWTRRSSATSDCICRITCNATPAPSLRTPRTTAPCTTRRSALHRRRAQLRLRRGYSNKSWKGTGRLRFRAPPVSYAYDMIPL